MCRAQHSGRYLEGQGHSMTFQPNSFQPITFLFEVEFYNYFTGKITILRQRVACNILVATLNAKITAWPCSKIVSGPKVIWSRILQLLLTNYFSASNTYSGSITWFRPALVCFAMRQLCNVYYMSNKIK